MLVLVILAIIKLNYDQWVEKGGRMKLLRKLVTFRSRLKIKKAPPKG